MSKVTSPILLDNTFKAKMDALSVGVNAIASAIGGGNVDTWAEFYAVIKHGYGTRLFPVGSQVTLEGSPTFDVVGHNIYTNQNDPTEPTVTLLSHDRILALQYDSPEAMYYCDTELAAGTYSFTATAYSSWAAGTYNFTLTKAVPAGGQLCLSGQAGTALTSLKMVSYESQTSTTALESVAIASGASGTSLGTWATSAMNHPHRMSYGSNNWKESAMRQFLNSDATQGSVWTPQTKFDRPPSWVSSQNGFLAILPANMVSVLMTSKVGNRTNNVYEAPDSTCGGTGKQYYTEDKIFLASMTEVGLGTEGTADGSVVFPYYVGAENADRIKKLNGSAGNWWLRSPFPSDASYVRGVSTSGALDHYVANYSFGVAAACTI